MAELLIVVCAIGLLAGVAVGGFNRVMQSTRETAACSMATLVNGARRTYGLTVPGAASQWASAADGAGKLSLLMQAGLLDGTASSYLTPATGYSMQVSGSLSERTVILHGDAQLNY